MLTSINGIPVPEHLLVINHRVSYSCVILIHDLIRTETLHDPVPMSMLIPPMSIPPIPPMEEEVLELMPPVEVAVMVMDEPMSIVWSISMVR